MASSQTIRRPADETGRRCAGSASAALRGNRGNRAESEDGSALVEFAVTLPLLFTLIFCFMEICLGYYTHQMISEAAREGTRYAVFHGASCTTSASASCTMTGAQVNSYVLGLGWANGGGGTISVATTFPDGNEAVGSRAQVVVTYVFPITMPFVPRNSLTMSSTSVMDIVQ